MNKSVVGWIVAGLLGFLFFVTAIGLIVCAYFWNQTNTELTQTKADLETANNTIATKTAELATKVAELKTANAKIVDLTTQLDASKAEAAKLQTSLDTANAAKDALQSKYDLTLCAETADIAYGTKSDAHQDILTYVAKLETVQKIAKSTLIYGWPDFEEMWLVDVIVDNGSGGNELLFGVFPTIEATYFLNGACWVQAPQG